MTNAFGKGDIVQLKSGGPPMTVDRVPGETEGSYTSTKLRDYDCMWFKGASRDTGLFGEHMLQPFVSPASKES